MTAEKKLSKLIASMTPTLTPEVYVFATVERDFNCKGLTPRMQFLEEEGMTLILPKHEAETIGIHYEFPCHMITLNIHSALDAVGFLATITKKLASLNMGVNPVSGFYHDHLFIPEDRAEDAMTALKELSETS